MKHRVISLQQLVFYIKLRLILFKIY